MRRRHPYENVKPDHPLFLLLADIARQHRVVIDIHHDVVTRNISTLPPMLARQLANPISLEPNVDAFERLLAHNRDARSVWAHAGSDLLRHWTAALSQSLLRRHSNLHMSIRLTPYPVFDNQIMDWTGEIDAGRLDVFWKFPNRFVIGGDQIFVGKIPDHAPAAALARRASEKRSLTELFLSVLPSALANKIGRRNALRLYRSVPRP